MIFKNLGNSAAASVVKLAVTLMITINYPFSAFGGVQNLENMVLTSKSRDGGKVSSDTRKHSGQDISTDVFCSVFVGPRRAPLRCGAVLLTAVVAGTVADFGFLTAFTGSLCNGIIAFVLPPLFYLRLHKGEVGLCETRCNWALMAAGAVFSVVSSVLLVAQKARS